MLVHAALAATLFLGLMSSADASDAMGPQLAEKLTEVSADEMISVLIVMKDRPDVAALDAAAVGLSKAERRTLVLDGLRAHAGTTQADLRQEIVNLTSEEHAQTLKYLWINNTIAGWLPARAIETIAARGDIKWIERNIPRQVFNTNQNALDPSPFPPNPGRANAWGVEWINAHTVWTTYNITGKGVVVSVVDTGTDYNHSDLTNNIWVNPGEDIDGDGVVWDSGDLNGVDDDGNGYVDDLVGYDFGYADNNPMDDYGHGTHCAGTVGGDGTGGTQTGVAPDATLMVCKVGYYINYSDEASMWEAWQYTAANGGDVITMSMRWSHAWAPTRSVWRDTCQATKAAGVMLVTAAGNERGYYSPPECVGTPADCPEVFAVGATGYKNDNIASFSSNGPTVWEEPAPYNDYPYPPGLVKPDIAAPGTDVNSTTWGGGYSGDTWSGTSMATPHVAGVVALMLEASPTLDPDLIQTAYESVAIDLGDPGHDNDFGWGQTDAMACVDAALNYADPRPDLKINNTDQDFSVFYPTALKIEASLTAGNQTGITYDWWIHAQKDGYANYWWVWPTGWTYVTGPRRALAYPLFQLNDYRLWNGSVPKGSWTFTFAVDAFNNIYEGTYMDDITVNVY